MLCAGLRPASEGVSREGLCSSGAPGALSSRGMASASRTFEEHVKAGGGADGDAGTGVGASGASPGLSGSAGGGGVGGASGSSSSSPPSPPPVPAPVQSGYRLPPPAVAAIVDAPQLPRVMFSPDRRRVLQLGRPAGPPPVAELSRPERRLAGVRLDPTGLSRSRGSHFTYVLFGNFDPASTVLPLDDRGMGGGGGDGVGGSSLPSRSALSAAASSSSSPSSPSSSSSWPLVNGPPSDHVFNHVSWSPDASLVSFASRPGPRQGSAAPAPREPLALWVADAATGRAKRLAEGWRLCTAFESPSWVGNDLLLAPLVPETTPDGPDATNATASTPPSSTIASSSSHASSLASASSSSSSAPFACAPRVEDNAGGKKAAARTYADLLSSEADAVEFERLAGCRLGLVDVRSGRVALVGEDRKVYLSATPSPNGRFLLVSYLQRPFSYELPYHRFPKTTEIWEIARGNVGQNADVQGNANAEKSSRASADGDRAPNDAAPPTTLNESSAFAAAGRATNASGGVPGNASVDALSVAVDDAPGGTFSPGFPPPSSSAFSAFPPPPPPPPLPPPLSARLLLTLASLPLADSVPVAFDACREGARMAHWRDDRPAEVSWVEATDGGDPAREPQGAGRDELWTLDVDALSGAKRGVDVGGSEARAASSAAPGTCGERSESPAGRSLPSALLPRLVWASSLRLDDVSWGDDEAALVSEAEWKTRKTRTWIAKPAEARPWTRRDWGARAVVDELQRRLLSDKEEAGEGTGKQGGEAEQQALETHIGTLAVNGDSDDDSNSNNNSNSSSNGNGNDAFPASSSSSPTPPPAPSAELLFDRSYEDSYSDPGSALTRRTPWGTRVLAIVRDADGSLDADRSQGELPLSERGDAGEGRSPGAPAERGPPSPPLPSALALLGASATRVAAAPSASTPLPPATPPSDPPPHALGSRCLLFEGSGASERGLHPFLDLRPLDGSGRRRRLWTCGEGVYETAGTILTDDRFERPDATAFAPPAGANAASAGGAGSPLSASRAPAPPPLSSLLLVGTTETAETPPQFVLRALDRSGAEAAERVASAFPHPFPTLRGVSKEILRYTRDDGVELTATLYLPRGKQRTEASEGTENQSQSQGGAPAGAPAGAAAGAPTGAPTGGPGDRGAATQLAPDAPDGVGATDADDHDAAADRHVAQDAAADRLLPCLLWAYPREFKTRAAAGQLRRSPHQFSWISPLSPVVWAAAGVAVLDGPTFPIVAEGDEEPNDTFVQQLVASARAAIAQVAEGPRAVVDPARVAVGGHSYGAFMAGNLLAHAPGLFACGVGRSGAYNRTLTPFGFQQEQRTLWEAPEVYLSMSPFVQADKVADPLLFIHGEADENAGTYPMQSERMYAALKGNGKRTRLVILPYEGHGYRARDSIMHTLYETGRWLNLYCAAREAANEDAAERTDAKL